MLKRVWHCFALGSTAVDSNPLTALCSQLLVYPRSFTHVECLIKEGMPLLTYYQISRCLKPSFHQWCQAFVVWLSLSQSLALLRLSFYHFFSSSIQRHFLFLYGNSLLAHLDFSHSSYNFLDTSPAIIESPHSLLPLDLHCILLRP